MRRGGWIVILVVVVISVLGIIVYSLDKKTSKTELADWKTFNDVKSGFSLKYPNNGWSDFFKEKSSAPLYLKNNKTEKQSYSIEIFALENITLNKAIETDSTIRLTKGESQRTDMIIEGKEAAKIAGIVSQGGTEDRQYINTLIQNGNSVIKIVLLDKADEEIYNQIFLTIKFGN
jgi:hypothetical protein